MNNLAVETLLNDCRVELVNITSLLTGLGDGALPTPYIKRYAVIRASGVIETAFKQIISDKVEDGSHEQIKNFIRKKIRESSYNPKLGIIENILSDFDDRWRTKFDELVALADKPKLKGSLTKLVDARNSFAHGGTPDLEISKTKNYFEDGVEVIKILDTVLNYIYT